MDRETVTIDVVELLSFPSTFGSIDDYYFSKSFVANFVEKFYKLISLNFSILENRFGFNK